MRAVLLVLVAACNSVSAVEPDAPPGPRVASWDNDVRITNTAATSMTIYNFGKSIAAASGRVHAVWHEDGAAEIGTAQVYYARSTDDGASWEPMIRLSTSTARAFMPTIAAEGDTVVAVWTEDDSATQQVTVHARRSHDGGASWEADQTLTTSGRSAMTPVAIADGHVYVAWGETLANGWPEIYERSSSDGGTTWDTPVLISDSPDSASWVPTVTAVGDLVVVGWVDYRDANEEEYVRTSPARGASWGPITRLTDDGADSWAPSIAISGDNVYITWFDRRDAGATDVDVENALDDALVLVGQTPTPPPARDPTIYYLTLFQQRIADKQTLLMQSVQPWVQGGGDPLQLDALLHTFETKYRDWTLGWELYIKTSPDRGTSWGADTRLTTAAGMSARPSIVAAGDEIHIAWFDGRDGSTSDASMYGGFTEIYYKASTDRGQTWTTDTRLTNATGDSSMASLALDGDHLHVLWSDMRDGNAETYYKRGTLSPSL